MDAHIPLTTPAPHRRTRLVLAVAAAAGLFAAVGFAALQPANPDIGSRVEIAALRPVVASVAASPAPFIDHSVVQSLSVATSQTWQAPRSPPTRRSRLVRAQGTGSRASAHKPMADHDADQRRPTAPMPPRNDEGAAPRGTAPLGILAPRPELEPGTYGLPDAVTMTSEPQQLPFLACPGGQKPPPLCWVWLPWGSMTTAPEGVYTAQPDRRRRRSG